jgi:hypothetical protein
MMTPARPLDIVHTVDSDTVDNLFEQIMNSPPTIPMENENSVLQAHVVTSQKPNNESR